MPPQRTNHRSAARERTQRVAFELSPAPPLPADLCAPVAHRLLPMTTFSPHKLRAAKGPRSPHAFFHDGFSRSRPPGGSRLRFVQRAAPRVQGQVLSGGLFRPWIRLSRIQRPAPRRLRPIRARRWRSRTTLRGFSCRRAPASPARRSRAKEFAPWSRGRQSGATDLRSGACGRAAASRGRILALRRRRRGASRFNARRGAVRPRPATGRCRARSQGPASWTPPRSRSWPRRHGPGNS